MEEFLSNERILKLLFSMNPWWEYHEVPKEYLKDMKRFAYYEAFKIFKRNDLRRFVVLKGARRIGKTTIMYQMIDTLIKEGIPYNNILYVSFDHPLFSLLTLDKVLEVYKENVSNNQEIYCFFDEIQYMTNWNSYLKLLYDLNPYVHVLATGSSSSMLQDKSLESGLGRWITLHVPTLSFYEYCKLLNIEVNDLESDIKPSELYLKSKQEQMLIFQKLSALQVPFLRYLELGGFPELAFGKDDFYAQKLIKEGIIEKALKMDISTLYEIRNTNDLEKVFMYLCYCSANIININTMVKELDGVDRRTIEKYIDYLEKANLIYISPLVNINAKKALKAQNKIYIADIALRNAILLKKNIINDPNELGIIAETVIYQHVKSFYYDVGTEVGYYRDTSKGKEIDIVVKSMHFSPILIEVKYREQSKIKESDAIISENNFKNIGLVITKNPSDYGLFNYGEKRIYKIPAPAFLYLLGKVSEDKYQG